jgi:hypothetical protein
MMPHICVATRREAARDWHYVSDAFSRAYDTRFVVSWRLESRDEMLTAYTSSHQARTWSAAYFVPS